jgi:hypothetical protein
MKTLKQVEKPDLVVDAIAGALFLVKRDALGWPPIDWEYCCTNMPSLAEEMRICARAVVASINNITSRENEAGRNMVQSLDLSFKNAFVASKVK